MDEAVNQEPQIVMHPEKRRSIIRLFINLIKRVLNAGGLPRVLISIRVDSHLTQQVSITVDYPGLSAEKALPLIAMAGQVLARKAKEELAASGPKIVVPS